MNRVVEQFRAPNAITPGPYASFLGYLLVHLQQFLAEMARRVNLTAPKDGSEPVQMIAYESVDFTISADVDDADPGYYAVVRCNVTGANRNISGLVDGAGQEGVGGRVVTLMNVSATYSLVVTHEDTGSAAANRFKLPRALSVTIAPEMSMTFWYDLADSRWRVL